MKKIIIVDGNSLLFRAYFATSFTGNIMRRKDGFPTNALFGFSSMINKILSLLNEGDSIYVSFDTGHKTFRHEKMESYKAQRKPIDEDLKLQIPYARDLLKAMGVYYDELEGYEGDDLAGTVAKLAESLDYEVLLYTSDKDYLQLISDHIKVAMVKKGLTDILIVDKDVLKEQYQLTPEQVKDFKGLMGDPSDNIKGIPGVGEKTALKLIAKYGSLEDIFEGIKDEKSKLAEKILANQDLGRFCKEMATIDTHVPLKINLEDTVYKGFDYNALSDFYTKFEFFSLLKKLKVPEHKVESISVEPTYLTKAIESISEIKDPIEAFLLVYDKQNYHLSSIKEFLFLANNVIYSLDNSLFLNVDELKQYFENEEIEKATYNVKAAYVLLKRIGITLKNVTHDIFLATYLIDSSLNLDEVSVSGYWGYNVFKNSVSSEDLTTKHNNLLFVISKTKKAIIDELTKINNLELYQKIELPLAIVLAKMELEGFPLNKKKLEEINVKYQQILNEKIDLIHQMTDSDINLASPKQLAALLFDQLGLKANKKRSTSIEVLNSLINNHPVIKEIIEFRKYQKIVSTYSNGLKEYIMQDGKIHALFNQAITTTGRLSSSEPNLQNISIKDEAGKEIRKAFFYDEDDVALLSLDYSQIELRLLASMANCPKLIEIFNEGRDIHSETAREVFHIPSDQELPSNLRRKAKAINFGIVYGISDFGLSEQISSSVSEAKEIITHFYQIYPEIKAYFDKNEELVEKNQYVETLFKRRRYIKDINSDNYQLREFSKRAAKNAPIQGTAADIIKLAMIKIDEKLTELKLKSKLVLQIHDELIFKVYKDEEKVLFNLVKQEMENVLPLNVKLEVDGGIGRTWYDAK